MTSQTKKTLTKKLICSKQKIDAKLAELEAQKGKGGNAEKEQLLAKQLGEPSNTIIHTYRKL